MIKQTILLATLILFGIAEDAYSQAVAPEPNKWLNVNDEKNIGSNALSEIATTNPLTGVATVNIPFYKYGVDGASLGVAMTYTTSGIQVDQISSNIGLGWNLYTGGKITRQVRGIEDEVIENTSCFYLSPIHGYWTANPTDEEPDIFYASFGGREMKFLFSKTGELCTIPESNIKIERYINNSLTIGTISSSTTSLGNSLTFVITDESGNKFYFVKGKTATKTETASLGQTTCTKTYYKRSEWVLEKVVPYSGGVLKQVNYVYEYSNINELIHATQTLREVNNNWSKINETPVESVQETARLLKIEYPNNINVEFSYDKTKERCDLLLDYRLKEIIVTERNIASSASKSKYSYLFNHEYFLSPDNLTAISSSLDNTISLTTNCSTYSQHRFRLKLNDIYFSSNNQSKLLYKFGYSSMPLPARVYGNRDKYGYANEHTPPYYNTPTQGGGYLKVPNHNWPTNTSNYIGMNYSVSSNIAYTKACILEKVTNGATGEISFEYSKACVDGNGVKVDNVKYYDGYNHDNDKTVAYVYSTPFSNTATDMWYERNQQGSNAGDPYFVNKVWHNSNWVYNSNINGPNHGYQNVEEKKEDKNGVLISKKVYSFSGFSTHNQINSGTDDNDIANGNQYGWPPYSNKQVKRQWAIGLPLKIEYRDHNSELLSEEFYYYTVTELAKNSNDFKGVAKLPKKLNYLNQTEDVYSDTYYPYTGKVLLDKKIERRHFNGANYIDKESLHYYDSKGNIYLSTVVNKTSSGTTVGIGDTYNYFYSYNWINSGYNPGTAISQLNQDGVESLVLSEHRRTNQGLVASDIAGYTVVDATNKILAPKYQYKLSVNEPLNNTAGLASIDMNNISLGNQVSNYKRMVSITKYDDRGFSIEKEANNNQYIAKIWDNENNSLLAEVSNAKYQEIAYCGFESNYYTSGSDYKKGNLSFNNTGITSSNSFLGRFSFLLSSSNTISSTGTLIIGKKYTIVFWVLNGGTIGVNDGVNPITLTDIRTYNGWTLKKAEFTAQANTIGIWGTSHIDEIRLCPSEAAMKTHNYLPLIGKTEDVGINNDISFYEYDDFGELSLIRDNDGNIISKIKTVTQGAD